MEWWGIVLISCIFQDDKIVCMPFFKVRIIHLILIWKTNVANKHEVLS